jgi:RND family efflux transporter MFP subunit
MLKITGRKRWPLGLALSALFLFLLFVLLTVSCKKEDKVEMASAGHEAHSHEAPQQQPQSKKPEEKKVIYQCPMHPNYTSDKPGDCPICGMTLVPVEEEPGEMQMEMAPGAVMISREKQEKLGVTFGEVSLRKLERTIRTVAKFTYDETKIVDINTKFAGWIEELNVDFTGQLVRKGQPLFSIYSPELVSAQEEYLLAIKADRLFAAPRSAGQAARPEILLDTARKRLLNWDITGRQIEELENTGKSLRTMVFYAPFTGFVVEKNILLGKHAMAGENLYKLADISWLWVLADIYEYDMPFISLGARAEVELPYFPGEVFQGKVTYIYPYLQNETRTVKARLELPNPGFRLKPEMFGTFNLRLDLGERLTVPSNAVLDSGRRKIVFVAEGEGHFEPREVKLGARTDDYYEVLEGVAAGERIVTSANFLIDSESKLKSAIGGGHKH